MSALRHNRLIRELDMVRKSEYVAEVSICDKDIGSWQILLKSECLPDYLGALKLEIKFPVEYPFRPPTIKIPSVFHPNVYGSGLLCISTLHDGKLLPGSNESMINTWRPSLCLANILVGVVNLLEHPNPDSPANVDASKSFTKDRKGYDEKNCELKKIREDRLSRDKILKEQELSYNVALGMDQKKEKEVINKTRTKIQLEGGDGDIPHPVDEPVTEQRGIKVTQPIQTCGGRKMFTFLYDGKGKPSIGDLRKALKGQRPDVEIALSVNNKLNKVDHLQDDGEELRIFEKNVIFVDEQ